MLVELAGAEAREAPSCERALEVLAGWTPQVMVAEIEMGAVSELELRRRVQRGLARDPGADDQRLPHARAGGAGDAPRRGGFLAKPFANAELLSEVARCAREALSSSD